MLLLFLFIFGLAIGSFLNVLIDRLPNEESIVFPPSHCDYCKKPLAWYDLIPVLSFITLGGRCRYCHKSLSVQYPIVELITAMLFVLTFVTSPFTLSAFFAMDILSLGFYFFIMASFIVIFFADLKYGIIPDKIVFPAILLTILFQIVFQPELFSNHTFSGIGALIFFLAIFLFTRGRGMGFGDVKLSFLLGLIFGFPNIVFVLYIAFLTGAFFSIILIILQRKRLKETIPFGPFLILGALLVFFLQEKISLWILPIFTL